MKSLRGFIAKTAPKAPPNVMSAEGICIKLSKITPNPLPLTIPKIIRASAAINPTIEAISNSIHLLIYFIAKHISSFCNR